MNINPWISLPQPQGDIMTSELTEAQVREDLAYAKAALDRETARALKFGKRILELEAELAAAKAGGR